MYVLILIFLLKNMLHQGDNLSTTTSDFAFHNNNRQVSTDAFSPKEADIFDFIVVGSGSAGSVVTNRLVKDGKFKVLLLEKGAQPNILTEVPALSTAMYFTGSVDKYQIEKQEGVGAGLENGSPIWIKGKCLGGSSAVNYMIFTRGHRSDYDRWAALGNPGWSYEDVLPLFKSIEKTEIAYINASSRGLDGEINCAEASYKTTLVPEFVSACQESGLKRLKDYNSGDPLGVSYIQANTRNGRRCHSEKAFLRPIRNDKNVKIQTDSLVTKLLIDTDAKTVEGVEYEQYGMTRYAKATKEVILSAGAFGSAQILMLSGIGPKRHLEEKEIDVIKDLPVGRIITDHIVFPGLLFELNATVGTTLTEALNPINWVDFFFRGKGPLTVPSLAGEALVFVKSPVSDQSAKYPDIEYIFTSCSANLDYGISLKRAFSISSESYKALYAPYNGKSVWSTQIVSYHPISKGHMELRSKDPHDPPRFYGNYFTDPDGMDVKTIVAGIRIIQEIAKSPHLTQYGSKLSLRSLPSCVDFVPDSDEFWECQIKNLFTTLWHQSSTCKMGPVNDSEAVVDNELRVYGMKNLRVADTSVIPITLSAHLHIPASMVGEKAARLLLKKY